MTIDTGCKINHGTGGRGCGKVGGEETSRFNLGPRNYDLTNCKAVNQHGWWGMGVAGNLGERKIEDLGSRNCISRPAKKQICL